jgi:hypothetical protein
MDRRGGLLGMAFHPDFPADRRVYLFYSHRVPPTTPPLMSRLSEFTATDRRRDASTRTPNAS